MNTAQLKNGKYFFGKYKDSGKNHKGWFIGSFLGENHPAKTDKIEICYFKHKKGEIVKPHYHKLKIELLIILKGKVKYSVNSKGKIIKDGDFVFVDVNNISAMEILENTELFAIHSPSISSDKTVVE